MRIWFGYCAVMILLSGCLTQPSTAGKSKATQGFILVAHRGGVVDDERSENSIKALDEAVRRGYTHVEVDARCTKDGHVVCFHLNNMKSETGLDVNIEDLTLEEVRKIVLHKSQEHIPTFDEFCSRCEGRINVMVDVKGVNDQWLEPFTKEIEAALIRHHLLDQALFIINRFPIRNQEKVAAWFLGRAKISWRVNLQRGRLLKPHMPDVSKYYFIFNSPIDFTQEDIRGFHKMGLKVIASVNVDHYRGKPDPMAIGSADIQKMLEWGVDGLQIDSCYDPPVFAWLKQ
ncbi:glycerophosphodiester phosphodiesterase family protein [bacterium]|nr:glycerophosphodiester phosphodiesterase family protein [bacterium]